MKTREPHAHIDMYTRRERDNKTHTKHKAGEKTAETLGMKARHGLCCDMKCCYYTVKTEIIRDVCL